MERTYFLRNGLESANNQSRLSLFRWMGKDFGIFRLLLVAFMFLIGLSGSASAFTQGVCGQTITGDTTLTLDLLNCPGKGIIIGADNIILDGAGYSITGSGGYGVYLNGRSGVTIKDLAVSGFGYGIYLVSSSNNTLTNNNANSNNVHGIYLRNSSGNTLTDNNANSNGMESPWGDGILLYSSSNNILTNNNANSNNFHGISLDYSISNTLTNNNANSNNKNGISHRTSSGNILTGNNANSNNNVGIWLYESSNYNTITNNNANSNNNYGIYLSSSGNEIYNNYFNNINNYKITVSSNSNTWNTAKTPGTNIVGGPYLGGNYWANPSGTGFSETCMDADADGICDLSYTLASGNGDYLPLSLNFTLPTTTTPSGGGDPTEIPEFPTTGIPALIALGGYLAMRMRRGE